MGILGWGLAAIGAVAAAYAIAEMRWAGDPDNMGELFEQDWHSGDGGSAF